MRTLIQEGLHLIIDGVAIDFQLVHDIDCAIMGVAGLYVFGKALFLEEFDIGEEFTIVLLEDVHLSDVLFYDDLGGLLV